MSLKQRTIFYFSLLLIFFIGAAVTVYYFQFSQKLDAVVIDAAGRNRMLSQRIGFLSEQAVRGGRDVGAELREAVDLYDASFYAIKNGGVVLGIAGGAVLPPSPPGVLPLVLSAEELWQAYKKQAEIIAREPIAADGELSVTLAGALDFIEANETEMLARNHAVTEAYVELNRIKNQNLFSVFLAIGAINAGIIALSFYLMRIFVLWPLERLKSGVDSVKTGNLDYRLSVLRRDEIGQLSAAFNEMVAEIRERTAKLKEAEAEDKAMLFSVAEGLVAVDKEERVMFVNKAFEEILGWKGEEVKGKKFTEFIPLLNENGEPIPASQRPIAKALKGITTITTVTSAAVVANFYRRKDGSMVPVSINVAPVILDDQIAGVIEVFHDITKENEIEKARTDFLTLASHQLRTPLSGTKWLIETIRRGVIGQMTEKQKSYLDRICQINERMIGLVSDMLNALRIESGAAAAKQEAVLFRELFKEISLTMASAADAKKITLRNALENREAISVESDAAMLRNILECFVGNAINYSNPGREVVVGAREEPATVVFSVKDSGIGIPREERRKITERFYRASNAKLFNPEGTGLGLYIASMLAEKIGAEIFFESEEGKGSTFFLRVPKKVANNKTIKNNH